MRAFGLTMLGLLAACAARPAARSRGTITQHPDIAGQHPNPRFEVREIQPTDTIWLEPDDQREDRDLQAVLTPPSSADAVSFTGPTSSDDALSAVDATASLPDGRLLVLDRQASVVRIVSPTGQQLGRIGRPGRGPGDFFRPLSIAVDAASNVYVGDLLRRVQRFRPDGPGFTLDTVLPVTASALGLCLLDSLLVVHGTDLTDPSVIQIYTTHGEPVRRFGATYRAPTPMLNWQYGRGRIACLPEEGRIAYVAGGVPVLRVFTPGGRTVRLAVVADAHPTVVTELPNDAYKAVTAPDGRLDHVVALVALPAGGLLLQVGVSTPASEQAGDDYARLISIVLPPEAGGPIERTTAGSQVAGILGGRPVFSVTEPSPEVTWTRHR
jgi:hypothetical protein